MIVRNISKNNTISINCKVADSFFTRLVGLIGKKQMSPDFALYIPKCNSIHMFFMSFPIDVCFLSDDLQVVVVLPNLRPWQSSKTIKTAQNVLELPADSIEKCSIQIGDHLSFLKSDE